jgi:hypothetical protein
MISGDDRWKILDLYARQSHYIDGGDARSWSETFTDDGRFVSPTYNLTAVGRTELCEFAESSNSAAWARGEQLRHWTSQHVLEPSGDGVRVVGYMLIVATSATASRIDRSIVFTDDLREIDGSWLVASRVVRRDGIASVTDA